MSERDIVSQVRSVAGKIVDVDDHITVHLAADEIERLREALTKIEKWYGEFPPTGRFWDKERTEPMSYSACFGSNGERDYMRGIARAALYPNPDRMIPQ